LTRSCWKRSAIFVSKIGIAIALLVWLVASDRLQVSNLSTIRVGWPFFGLIALTFGSMVLPAVRWWWLMRIQKITTSMLQVVRLTWFGYIASLVLPGAASGDIARSVLIVRDKGDARARAFSTVLADRFLGLYSLFLLGLTSLLVSIIGGGTRSVSPMRFLPTHLNRAMGESIEFYREERTAMFGCLCVSLLSSVMTFAAFTAASQTLGNVIPWTHTFVTGPLIVLSNCLPITPGGAGIAEATSSELFAQQGFANGAEVMLLTRICTTILSIPGLLGILLTGSSDEQVSDMIRCESN
jgi:uncharacterized membrane protein YbhN (UPF0104 family)